MRILALILLLSACGGGRTCPRSAADTADSGGQSAEQSCKRARR